MHGDSQYRARARCLQLDQSFERHVRAAALSVNAEGGVFECTVGGLTKDVMATLDDAIYSHVPVQLEFATSSLLVDLRSVESTEAHTLRIVGEILAKRPARTRFQ